MKRGAYERIRFSEICFAAGETPSSGEAAEGGGSKAQPLADASGREKVVDVFGNKFGVDK